MKAVGLVHSLEHVCCRYRLRAFAPKLQSRDWHVETRPVSSGLLHRLGSLYQCHDADAVVLQRKLLDAVQLRLLRYHARRLLFDFDDAVLLRDSYATKSEPCRRRLARFRRTIQAADAVIAGNSYLAEQADQFTDPARVFVVPTCVEPDKYHPLPVKFARKSLELVWIGSSSTLRALECAQGLLNAIGREVPSVRLKVICNRFPVFRNMPVVPVWWSEATEAHELAVADVGISWLPDDPWTRGKCALKVLQYMAAGLPVVASRVGVHPEMIEHGRSGFLVESEAEWVEAIQTLARNAELRQEMGRRGREIVEEWYSVSRWSPMVEQILAGEAAPVSAPVVPVRCAVAIGQAPAG